MTDNIKVTDEQHRTNMAADYKTGILCEVDGVFVHSVPMYLARTSDMTVDQYLAKWPGSPLYSEKMLEARKRKAERDAKATASPETMDVHAATVVKIHDDKPTKQSFAKVFGLGNVRAAKNMRGEDIMIEVMPTTSIRDIADFVPEIDEDYIFPIDNLKAVLMSTVLNIPMLTWGMHGTGKTTLIQQFCARTNRPAIRVQHTASTEEAHVLGQYVVRNVDGHAVTVFEPGPLPYAMRNGLVYIADEYDFALPSVTSVYQPVLEGQSLIIKEAPSEWRVVKPHPNFRFYATGNTNGGGDDTGLYQGTQMQNAANYSRFGMTIEVQYMPHDQEVGVVSGKGGVHPDDATKFVELAKSVRDSYGRGEIGATLSTRELIRAAMLGRTLGGQMKQGLAFAFTNRLNKTDREAVLGMAQRIFGS